MAHSLQKGTGLHLICHLKFHAQNSNRCQLKAFSKYLTIATICFSHKCCSCKVCNSQRRAPKNFKVISQVLPYLLSVPFCPEPKMFISSYLNNQRSEAYCMYSAWKLTSVQIKKKYYCKPENRFLWMFLG